jgi:hypothetical protein
MRVLIGSLSKNLAIGSYTYAQWRMFMRHGYVL